MKRRDFLKNSMAMSAGSFLLSNLPFRAFASESMIPLLNCPNINDRVLVILFLKGGNDGLNTLVPINQYDTYAGYRPGIKLSDTGTNAFVPLDNTLPLADQVGLHPVMSSFKSMYDNAQARIIQRVGYPNSNGSHFKSTDLWMSGGDGTPANFNLSSGWMGRFLNTAYPGLYGNPIPEFPDPLGIQLGDRKPSLGFYNDEGLYMATNLSQQDPNGLYDSIQGIGTAEHSPLPNSEYGQQIAHIMQVENNTNIYAQRVTNVFGAGTNSSTTYPDTNLGNQFKTVAKLLSGGSMTKVFLLHHSGFDTHAGQSEAGSSHIGRHAELLSDMFDSIKAFHEDLTNLGIEQRVLTSAFSEFGRQVIENGSLGTDHGNFGPVFLFGSSVKPGMTGTNIDLSDITSGGKPNETQLQFDYRQMFRTLLQDWLGASDSVITEVKYDVHAHIPDLVETNIVVDPTCYVDTYVSQIQIKAKVFLEGFYDPNDGELRTDLVEKGLIPLTQPYNTAPFNYIGTENVTTIPWNVADWVLIELRDSSDINIVVAQQAAFLRNDGLLMDLNGNLGVTIKNVDAGSYYITIYHRNHIAVVSSVPYDSSSSTPYDFTTAVASAYGTNQLKDMGAGAFAMFAGDFDASGINDTTDLNTWKANSSIVNEYRSIDGDGNGVVNNLDYNLWKRNQTQQGDPIIQP